MRIVVVGGTGRIGSVAVDRLRSDGHDVVAASRSEGVDAVTGDGLAVVLKGADVVVDSSSTAAQTAEETTAFFGAVARNLQAAEADAGVGHHVLLSITNMDKVASDVPHYAGKRLQEEIVQAGSTPWTIVRAAQFMEFGEMVASWTRQGNTVVVPPVVLQPVAAVDVGRFLAVAAEGPPQGIVSIAGPERIEFPELVRRTFEAKAEQVEVVPSFEGSIFGADDGDAFLAPSDATLAPTTLEEWLKGVRG